jgi:type IV pilus assembly protein PilN
MIRINLLPEAKKKEVGVSGSSQIWLVIYLVTAAAWAVLLLLFYWHFESKLEEKEAANAELQKEIARAEKQNANLDEIQQKLERSKRLERVVNQLQKARSGPTRMLTELSRLISKEGGPTVDQQVLENIRREQPLAGYNPAWDFRRLWISSFVEKDHRCSIRGIGKTNEDVAEFLRRLMLSEVFTNVYLEQTTAGRDGKTKLPTVSFSISCKVRY